MRSTTFPTLTLIFVYSPVFILLWGTRDVGGTISVISQETGDVVRVIEDRNIRSMSDALEGYVINSNPLNVCEVPDPPPEVKTSVSVSGNGSGSAPKKIKFILLGVIYDCDLTTKARNAHQSGYSGLIIQNIGTNNSHLIPWHIMRFPLAKINHVVVGEFDGFLLRYNYSYPDNGYYIKFEEDHFYQVLCYVLAAIILLLLSTMFLLFWFQVCCTIIALRLPYRLGQRFQNWLHPSKRRLTRPMLQLLPVKNWTHTDPFQVCAICQEDFREDEKVRLLPCSHAFHSACIDPWLLKRSRRCPNCMQRVKLPTEHEDEDESEYSSTRTHNRSHSRRTCSQSSHQDHDDHDHHNSSPTTDNAPLIHLPDAEGSPKPKPKQMVILDQDTHLNHADNENQLPESDIVTVTEESSTRESRDWQLKRFLQNFNYVPSSDGSRSCSLSLSRSINNFMTKPKSSCGLTSGLKAKSSSFHSHSQLKSSQPQDQCEGQPEIISITNTANNTNTKTMTNSVTSVTIIATEIPLCSVRIQNEIFLETCLDVPSSSVQNKSIAVDEIPHRVVIPGPLPDLDGDSASLSLSQEHDLEQDAQAQAQRGQRQLQPANHAQASGVPQASTSGSRTRTRTRSRSRSRSTSVSVSASVSASASALPREYSNPGYVSFDDEDEDDDNDDSDEATEEQNITSSFDATTISESLPCDDPSSQAHSHPISASNDNDFDDSIMSDRDFQETDSLQIEIEDQTGQGQGQTRETSIDIFGGFEFDDV